MSRRGVITARTQHELRLAMSGRPSLDILKLRESNGRWDYRPDDSRTRDDEYYEWGIHPTSAPATATGEFHGRPRTVYYDPELTDPPTPGEFRFEHSYQGNDIADLQPPAEGFLWRGMGKEEYEEARERGYFESRGEANIGDSQVGKSYFSTRPGQAANYASGFALPEWKPTFTHPGYVVGIPDRPDLPREGDTEVGVPGRIPFSEVQHSYRVRPVYIEPGDQGMVNDWSGWTAGSSSPPSAAYHWEPHIEPGRTAAIFPPHDEGMVLDPKQIRQAPADAKWYHTSPARLEPGERLRPFGGERMYGDAYDRTPQYQHRDQHIWTEYRPSAAEEWATGPSKYIYEIEPDETPQAWNGNAQEGWVTPGATIKKRLTDNYWLPMNFEAALRRANELLEDPRRVEPDYFTGIHEMGHVLDLMGQTDRPGQNTRARSRLNDELIKHYVEQYPERAKDVIYQQGPGYEPQHGVGPGMPEFGQWLRNQLPGGAFQGNPSMDSTGDMNHAEGIAHAFTEGELNPQANDVAKLIHRIVTEESRPETSQVLRERMENPYYRERWEKQYGPYTGHDPAAPLPAPVPPKATEQTQQDLPYGISRSIEKVQEKYPQAVVDDLQIDETNPGGVAFITPDQKTGFEPGKPSVTKNRPDFSVEREWVDKPLSGPGSWTEWMDQGADEGFFPRWQSTTAGEPWPEDSIEDLMTEFDGFKHAGLRTDPAELPYRTLLWMNQNMQKRIRTPEEKAYSDALAAEVALRGQEYQKVAGVEMYADPAGDGVWRIGRSIEFLPRPT